MDWFSWLSKTSLEPTLVYEYGLAFAHNELEEEDISYLSHEFLQSMGISIAKHRLEILKLARKGKNGRRDSYSISKLILAIKKTKSSLASCVRALVRREDRALVVVSRPTKNASSRWKSKKRKPMRQGEKMMMLTQGNGPLVVSAPRLNSFSSPLVVNGGFEYGEEEDDDDGGYWTPVVEETRWDTMFQDLNPT